MGAQFTSHEGRALYGLLAETADDIVLKTDRHGFVVHATPALERLGFALPHMLFGPHLADLARPDHAERLRAAVQQSLAGQPVGMIEFAGRTPDHEETWFEIAVRPLAEQGVRPYGTLAIIRSIDMRRALEEELFAAAMTDPLTGLTNRQAFLAMLGCLVESPGAGCLALFSIDHFKAINLRYGQAAGDRLLVAFADFLRAALRAGDTISRVGNQRFAVILPDTAPPRAVRVCNRALETLAGLGGAQGIDGLPVTASAGLAQLAGTVDATMRHAEMALFFARARGRNRLEIHCVDAARRAA